MQFPGEPNGRLPAVGRDLLLSAKGTILESPGPGLAAGGDEDVTRELGGLSEVSDQRSGLVHQVSNDPEDGKGTASGAHLEHPMDTGHPRDIEPDEGRTRQGLADVASELQHISVVKTKCGSPAPGPEGVERSGEVGRAAEGAEVAKESFLLRSAGKREEQLLLLEADGFDLEHRARAAQLAKQPCKRSEDAVGRLWCDEEQGARRERIGSAIVERERCRELFAATEGGFAGVTALDGAGGRSDEYEARERERHENEAGLRAVEGGRTKIARPGKGSRGMKRLRRNERSGAGQLAVPWSGGEQPYSVPVAVDDQRLEGRLWTARGLAHGDGEAGFAFVAPGLIYRAARGRGACSARGSRSLSDHVDRALQTFGRR